MHRFILAALAAAFALPVMAQQNAPNATAGAPFVLLSSTPETFSAAELAKAEKDQTQGTLSDDKKALTFTTLTIRIVAHTGPEDDMLSYRIQGARTPNLIVPANAVMNILFVNTDADMPHDIHFGPIQVAFPIAPSTQNTTGTEKLPHQNNGQYAGEELSLRAVTPGSYTYFCSVRGHAKGGMAGLITVSTAQSAPAHTMNMPGMTPEGHEGHEGQAATNDHAMPGMAMRSSVDLNDSMNRESSGTSWVPDSTPLYAYMRMHGNKMLMLHGDAFPRYTSVGGERDVSIAGQGGRDRFDAPTMFMGMYSQPLGAKGQFGARLMTSLDPIIEGGHGYPLLYQSGETYKGQPIHDRQHPHDLISELALTYSRQLGRNSAYLYVGYPGEPALGPPTFMHRLSGMDDPDAPISHHWQDSTHITYGVVTAGYSFGKFKLEGSAFKGEEPNENRYNFDSPRLDSFSGRLSWNPNRDLALQVSHGFLKRPEPAEQEVTSRHRTTASILYNRPIGDDANWSNALVWGQNDDANEGQSNAYLAETNLQLGRNTFYSRFEHVQKSGHELVLPTDEQQLFGINALALGYVRDLRHGKGVDIGLGAQVTLDTNPSGLDTIYGGGNHTGFQVFLRLRPSRLRMDEGMAGMNMKGMK